MSVKSYTGVYDIVLEDKVKTKIFPNVTVEGRNGKVVLSSKGKISTEATGLSRKCLSSPKVAGIFAARVATGLWFPFNGLHEEEYENGARLPIEVTLTLYPDKVEIDAEKFETTARVLLDVDADVSLFLMRALELQMERNELAVLNALLGLDLQLARIVPEFSSWDGRRRFLSLLNVLSLEAINRLKNLSKLRNTLAHGNWTNEKVGNQLNDLLQGGREKWLIQGRMSTLAARKVIEETVAALRELIQCKGRLETLREEIAKS